MAKPVGGFHPGNTGDLKSQWAAYLEEKNLHTTQQRELIVDQFLKCTEHVSIDDLLARVRKRQEGVGYATVYRTLKLLVDSGLATKRQFTDGQTHFEVAGDHHDHLICTECGHILEFEDEEIEKLQERIAARLGFSVSRHRHELYGLCERARGIEGGRCPDRDSAA